MPAFNACSIFFGSGDQNSGGICAGSEMSTADRSTAGAPWRRANGAQGRDRTTDTAIFSRMLYQLSYLGISLGQGPGAPVYSQAGRACPPSFASGYAARGPASDACPASGEGRRGAAQIAGKPRLFGGSSVNGRWSETR
jgi:hypothetical protein